jgi:hypothetical protein
MSDYNDKMDRIWRERTTEFRIRLLDACDIAEEIISLEDRIAKLETELDEARADAIDQARLNGMGAERELKAHAESNQWRRRYAQAEVDLHKVEIERDGLKYALEAAPAPGTGILGAMNYKDGGLIESVRYDMYAKWYDGIRKQTLERYNG